MRSLALIALLAGCDRPCVCLEHPATLELQPPLRAPGRYSIHLVHDGVASDCTVDVPLFAMPECAFDFWPADDGSIEQLLLPVPWKRIELTIDRGGTRIAALARWIPYRRISDCAPDCVEADPVTVAVAQ